MIDPNEPRQRLTLEALVFENSSGQKIPASIRLRQILKTMLRSYGFKCVLIEELPNERSNHGHEDTETQGPPGTP